MCMHALGTFIHNQVGLWHEDDLFQFRFNDFTASSVDSRRTQKIPKFGTRTVYNVMIPMTKEPVFVRYPFQAFKLTAMIELSSSAFRSSEGEYELKPNLMLNAEDER